VAEISFVQKLIDSAPSLAAFVLIVYAFISYLRSRDEADERREGANRDFMERLGESCHQNHKEVAQNTAKSVDANTVATDKLRETIERTQK
jgi:hypothetical protein